MRKHSGIAQSGARRTDSVQYCKVLVPVFPSLNCSVLNDTKYFVL